MVPSVAFLTSMLTGLMAKVGIAQLTKHGYMPQSTYVKAALQALEKDDLDAAIAHYNLAVKRRKPSERTEVAAEIIASAITIRINRLEKRVSELEQTFNPPLFSRQYWRNFLPKHRQKLDELREEQKGCQEAISVLVDMLDKLEVKT